MRSGCGQYRKFSGLGIQPDPHLEKMKKILLAALAILPISSYACSFMPGYKSFVPSVSTFEARTDGGRLALLPAPDIKVTQVVRGTASPGASCDDAGTLTLELNWPKSSIYRLKEVGFYFRVVGGQQPDQIFPLVPVSGKIIGQKAQFFFVWLDGHPSQQSPLSLDVEVFAVNKGLEIGPSRRFRVGDAMRKTKDARH